METLKTSHDFERVRRAGRTWASGPLLLNAAPNDLATIRCGFITGKKIGGAVKRNRARRLLKEAVRQRLARLKPGWDLVWIARPSIEGATLAAVLEAVDAALHRGKLYASHDFAVQAPSATEVEFSRIIDRSREAPSSAEQAKTPGQADERAEGHEPGVEERNALQK